MCINEYSDRGSRRAHLSVRFEGMKLLDGKNCRGKEEMAGWGG